MKQLKLQNSIHCQTSAYLNIIILYSLIINSMILLRVNFVYFSRNIRNYVIELSNIRERLSELEATQVIITTSTDEYDVFQRKSRHAHIKSKLLHRIQKESNSIFGSIQF